MLGAVHSQRCLPSTILQLCIPCSAFDLQKLRFCSSSQRPWSCRAWTDASSQQRSQKVGRDPWGGTVPYSPVGRTGSQPDPKPLPL
jgi:hypothetical protein